MSDSAFPSISVIMPAHNVERFIAEAMRSVLSQDVGNLSLTVIDDGSTDTTRAVAEGIAKEDPRVTVLTIPDSGRPSIPRNIGIRCCTGDLVAFLDADDVFLPGKLSSVARVFAARPDVDVVFHDVNRMDEAGNAQGSYLVEGKFPQNAASYLEQVSEDLHVGKTDFYNYVSAVFCPLHTSATVVRRSHLLRQEDLFPENLRCGEDIDLWYRLLKSGRTAFIARVLSVYRTRAGSTTQDREDFYLGTLRAHEINLARAADVLKPHEKARYIRRISERYQHLAYIYERHGQKRLARRSYIASFRYRWNARAILLYLKTLAPEGLKKLVGTLVQGISARGARAGP